MTDDAIFRPAMPVLPSKQEERVRDAELLSKADRSLSAKRAWQTRRANAVVNNTPAPPDRHRPGLFTAQEAIQLARLMVDYPFLRKLVE